MKLHVEPHVATTFHHLFFAHDSIRTIFTEASNLYPAGIKNGIDFMGGLRVSHLIGDHWRIRYGVDYLAYNYSHEQNMKGYLIVPGQSIQEFNRIDRYYTHKYLGLSLGGTFSFWRDIEVGLDAYYATGLKATALEEVYMGNDLIRTYEDTWTYNNAVGLLVDPFRGYNWGLNVHTGHQLNDWLFIGGRYNVSLVSKSEIDKNQNYNYQIYNASVSLFLRADIPLSKKKEAGDNKILN